MQSSSPVVRKEPKYRGHAYDADDHDREGYKEKCEDPEECGQAALDDLFKKYPDTAAKCGQEVLMLKNFTRVNFENLDFKLI